MLLVFALIALFMGAYPWCAFWVILHLILAWD